MLTEQDKNKVVNDLIKRDRESTVRDFKNECAEIVGEIKMIERATTLIPVRFLHKHKIPIPEA